MNPIRPLATPEERADAFTYLTRLSKKDAKPVSPEIFDGPYWEEVLSANHQGFLRFLFIGATMERRFPESFPLNGSLKTELWSRVAVWLIDFLKSPRERFDPAWIEKLDEAAKLARVTKDTSFQDAVLALTDMISLDFLAVENQRRIDEATRLQKRGIHAPLQVIPAASGKPMAKGQKPLVLTWQGTQGQLTYVLTILKEKGLIGTRHIWERAANSFSQPDGSSFTARSLSTAQFRASLDKPGLPDEIGDGSWLNDIPPDHEDEK